MKFLVDECLHTTLAAVAQQRGYECHHVVWLGLAGATDRELLARAIAEDFTFVTNNAMDFRRLYAGSEIHAGLVIIVPQVVPSLQRVLFDALLATIGPGDTFLNEAIEITLDDGNVVFARYPLPSAA